jgi:hypothetical protein
MAVSYTITYLPEGSKETFQTTRRRRYLLSGGSLIDMLTDPVWCQECKIVTEGETIPTLADLDEKIKQRERLGAEIRVDAIFEKRFDRNNPPDRPQQIELADLHLRRNWRLSRKSPPRCLRCGSTNIIALAHDKPVFDKNSGRSIAIAFRSFVDPVFESREIFSAEGISLPAVQ